MNAGDKVKTGKGGLPKINSNDILKDRRATVFRPQVGKIHVDPVVLEHKQQFKPINPPRRLVPHYHRKRFSKHLDVMRREGVIKDVDPNKPINCVLNMVILAR